jgi:hypothetical protein
LTSGDAWGTWNWNLKIWSLASLILWKVPVVDHESAAERQAKSGQLWKRHKSLSTGDKIIFLKPYHPSKLLPSVRGELVEACPLMPCLFRSQSWI